MRNIALIVHTCDRYQLLYRGFEHFFKKHWPYADVAISYYFLTEDVYYKSDIFTNIKTGKGEWSDRLLNGLKKISEEHIIYMQEDMWLNKSVVADTVNKIINFSLSADTDLLKLSSNAVFVTRLTGEDINGLSVAVLDNEKSQYLMSHQVSIWKKSFLMAQLKYHEHPWRNERKGTRRLRKLDPEIYHIDLFSENDELPANHNADPSQTGSYYTVSKNAALREYANPFISEMKLDTDVTIREYAQQLDHHLKNGITHDARASHVRKTFLRN